MAETPRPRVHLLCGLNGAGKTTLARSLTASLPGVRFTLDEWMLVLYGLPYDDPEYVARLSPCKELIWATAQQVLAAGVDVILDWNQWSRARRAEWAARAANAGATAVVHFIDVDVDAAVARLRDRNATAPTDAHIIDDAGVRQLASIFEPPTDAEGLEIHIHS